MSEEQAEQPAEATLPESDLPKSFTLLPTVANPLIPRLIDLCLDTIINNYEQCTELHLVPRKYHQKILRTIPETIPFPIAVMTIPDGIFWKRMMLSQFPNVPRNPAQKTWKRFFLENYAAQKLENATEANIDETFNDLRILGPFIRKITLTRSPVKISMFKLFRTFRGLKSLSLVYGEPRRNFAQYEEFDNFDVRAEHSATLRDCQVMCTDFINLGKYCSLQEFDMSDNSLSDQAVVKVAEGLFKAFNSLTSLTFAHNEIKQKGAHAIGSVLLHSPIRKLDLSDNQIGSSGVQKLCECAKQCATLEELNLSSNQIGNNGILFVALLIKASKSLKKLDISGNRISNFKDIIEALNVTTSLVDLNIAVNPIDEDDYDVIQKLVQDPNRREDMVLDKLDMRRYDLTEEDFMIKTTETSEAPLLRFK
ncbi:hypothetical protein TRFO_25963 [Tritrichomonas foetus]|uniref:Leucine Rich Repeat family protein n=1 Tax=Tritrichomonas foetus TaxID=1144522 RepID=A0A1J4K8R6_9EUKA|nr:hypothetical protein TRFO_25963 [Tritrichomonas foetus]|eukprot:OHT06108.1 hypothetical protein TRFO_25963 [Tritrichomonas foetus]